MNELVSRDPELPHEFLALLTPDEFIDYIKGVLDGPSVNGDGTFYRFSFKKDEMESYLSDSNVGKPIHTPEELIEIKVRYTTMYGLLQDFVTKGFTLTRLIISNRRGLTGVSIEYITPKDRAVTARFVRSSVPYDIIPDDCLYELKHIPQRAN